MTLQWEAYSSSVEYGFFALTRRYPNVPLIEWEKLKEDKGVNQYLDAIISVYESHLSQEDIEAMIEFYASDVGKKIRDPKLLGRLNRATQDWAMELNKECEGIDRVAKERGD